MRERRNVTARGTPAWRKHTFDGTVVDVQMPGNRANALLFNMAVPQYLCLNIRGQGHGAFLF